MRQSHARRAPSALARATHLMCGIAGARARTNAEPPPSPPLISCAVRFHARSIAAGAERTLRSVDGIEQPAE